MKLVLCAALAAVCGTAAAEVNKCLDQEGHVLLTDRGCPPDSHAVAAPELPVAETIGANAVVTPLAPRSRWADLPRPAVRKTTSVDATTLQLAYQSMQMRDELHKPRRHSLSSR